MKRTLSAATAVVTIVAAVAWTTSSAESSKKEIVGLSTVVYARLLQRRQTASATVRQLQRRRHLDRSSENTSRCACPRAYSN
jgi:hypothetical protein